MLYNTGHINFFANTSLLCNKYQFLCRIVVRPNSIYPCCIYRFILPFYLITHGLILYSNSHFNQSLKLFSKMDESIQKDLASAQDMGWFNSNLNLMIPRSSPPRGVLRKRCSKNMQQIYRRTPMAKRDFNKVALQLYWNHTSA